MEPAKRFPHRAGLPSGRGRRGRGDPCLAATLLQLAACGLLAAACWLGRGQPWMQPLKEAYLPLLTARQEELSLAELGEGISQAGQGLAAWTEQATRSLWAKLWEDAPQPAPEVDLTAWQGLEGAGGWLGSGDAQFPQEAPASCSLGALALSAPLSPPVSGRITCDYGWRLHPISGEQDFHTGLDIAAPQGSGIYAALPGVVAEVGESAIYGNYLVLDHGGGLQTAYCHCDSVVAPPGALLRRGELVARVGSTGISTGPHLHLELLKGELCYDPIQGLTGVVTDGI